MHVRSELLQPQNELAGTSLFVRLEAPLGAALSTVETGQTALRRCAGSKLIPRARLGDPTPEPKGSMTLFKAFLLAGPRTPKLIACHKTDKIWQPDSAGLLCSSAKCPVLHQRALLQSGPRSQTLLVAPTIHALVLPLPPRPNYKTSPRTFTAI